LISDAKEYSLTVPRLGGFLQAVRAGRKEVAFAVRRKRYGEILLSELQTRGLTKTKLSVAFMVKDMIGASILELIPTTSGDLLRLPSNPVV